MIAIGLFAFGVLILTGLMVPTLRNLSESAEHSRTATVVASLDDFLGGRAFEDVYGWVAGGRSKILYGIQEKAVGTDGRTMRITESDDPSLPQKRETVSRVYRILLNGAIGPYVEGDGSEGRKVLPADMARYGEGYLVLEVNIFALNDMGDGVTLLLSGEHINRDESILSFTTAVVR